MSAKTKMQSPVQKKENKASGSRTIKLYISTFISNRTHSIQGRRAIIAGQINRNGFMGVLEGGFKSTGYETMESNLPNEIDLSIKQNKGFSLYFWFVINKPQTMKESNIPFFIFKKGNTVDQFTPTVGLMANGTSLFIQLNTSKSKKEILFCNKNIEYEHFYSFAVTFNIIYDEETTEISAYLDGKLDTQSTIPGEPIHNQGNAYLGKPDETSNGFKGTIADVILVPRILIDQEIKTIFEQGMENLNYTKGTHLHTYAIFNDLFERKKLIALYSKYTGKPIYAVENLNLSNERMKEVVKNYDIEEKKNNIQLPAVQTNVQEEKMIYNMSVFLRDENNDVITNKIMENARFINTVLYLANKGEDNLEVERIVKIFLVLSETLQFKVKEPYLIELGKNLNVITSEKVPVKHKQSKTIYYINVKKFFKNLKKSIQTLEERQRTEDEENAKYQTKRNKRKKAPPMIKSFYNSRRDKRAQTEENSQTTLSRRNQIFTDCIPEHEKLILKSQNMKNEIDDKDEENLESYQSTFVLKSIYEKPKFLPGENPEFPKVKLVETSLNESNIKAKAEDDKEEKEIDPEVIQYTKIFVDQIFTIAAENSQVNTDIVRDETTAATIQKNIYDKREEKRKLKEEMDRKRREAEEKKNEDEKEIFTEVKTEEKNDYDPVIPEGWADGNFEVVINHCFNCHKHETTTKHYEFYFVDKFNEIGDEISHLFSNCVIIGNLDKPDYLGNFDVYLRGTGLPGDEKGRYFIYKKIETLQFPSESDILDKLIALAIMYGNTMNIESAQMPLIKYNTTRLDITHEHPCSLSEDGEKRKQKLIDMRKEEPRIDPDHTKFKCVNWGCNAVYVQNENKKKCCRYHPGLWQFGSYNRSWPACWTCCEGKWESDGCKEGLHQGELLSKTLHLCLNHGEVNPRTGRPDWACGKYYTDKSDTGCLGHTGYYSRGRWTCCGGDRPCVDQKHATETHPNDKAQLHFYPKYVFNPGLKYAKEAKDTKLTTAQLICSCDYFKEKKEYPNAKEIHDAMKAKSNKEETMKRYCLNWTCEKQYTIKDMEEKKNKYRNNPNKQKNCQCHPGKWDHGSTGSTMVEYISEMNSGSNDLKKNKILWKPHWSCCRGDWKSPGCTRCDHHGPLEQDLPRYGKKYIWPDERMKLMFPKVVGDKWNEFVNQFRYEESKVRRVCRDFFKDSKQVPISDIPKLCDKLRLYYLIVQENPEWTMKFYDVVYQTGSIELFATGGMCDMEKFIQWWTKSYEEIYEILHPPKKVEPPPKEEEKTSK